MSAAQPTLVPVFAISKKRSLAERELTSWGGYGLKISPCPEETSSCGDACCPKDYKCTIEGDHKNGYIGAICCPTDADCSATVRVVSACADTSWGLYHAFEDFCCPSDFVGIYPNGGDNGPMCISESLPIPESALASSVKQATTTRAAVSTPGSSTTTSVSSSTTSPGSTSQSPPVNTVDGSSKPGLSQGATIAIAVLATALGLLSIFVIWYFWGRKRLSKRHVQSFSDPPAAESGIGLSGKSVIQTTETPELDTTHRAELHDTARV